MKRCIYGVDLNLMAVELAKLSLWLHSFTMGAPLSFLDHHLRWGNSLIGSDVRTVEQSVQMTEKGQLGLFQGPSPAARPDRLMTEVAEQADATLADVRQSAETFDRFQRDLLPYKQVLDLWVSQHFGNPAAREFLSLYGADVLAHPGAAISRWPTSTGTPFRRAGAVAATSASSTGPGVPRGVRGPAAAGLAESPGFDAVVGTRLISRRENCGELIQLPGTITRNLCSASSGKFDLYLPFLEQAWSLTMARQEGRPSSFRTSG